MGTETNWTRWVTGLGIVIALAGIVLGIWLQTSVGNLYRGAPHALGVQQRLTDAIAGLSMFAGGALLAVAAQIMNFLQAERREPAVDTAPPIKVTELRD